MPHALVIALCGNLRTLGHCFILPELAIRKAPAHATIGCLMNHSMSVPEVLKIPWDEGDGLVDSVESMIM